MNDILGVWIRIAIRSLEPVNLLGKLRLGGQQIPI